jgi:hypothetical protein
VIFTNSDLTTLLTVGEYCHFHKIPLIAADSKGLFSYVFADLASEFRSKDLLGDLDAEEIYSVVELSKVKRGKNSKRK